MSCRTPFGERVSAASERQKWRCSACGQVRRNRHRRWSLRGRRGIESFFSIILNRRVKLSPIWFFSRATSQCSSGSFRTCWEIFRLETLPTCTREWVSSQFSLRDRVSRLHVVEENPAAAEYARENLSGGSVAEERGSGNSGENGPDPVAAGGVVVEGGRCEGKTRSGDSGPSPDRPVCRSRSLLIRRQVPEIRYVSCNPVTLARDTAEFLRAGYRSGPCMLFDFYPQTAHVEAFLILTREVGSSP